MLKSFIVCTVSIVLLMSLACSLTVQPLYADVPVAQSAEEIQPLKSGQRAPAFTVQDVAGNNVDFSPNTLTKPAVIITFRGGWCPYCNMHLSELHKVVPAIAAMDIDVMFLSGDRPEMLYASLAAETQTTIAELDYTIYSDANAEAAIALGLAFEASDQMIQRRAAKGDDVAGSSMLKHGVMSVPAVYAVDRSGMIVFDFVEPDYKVRLPADELLAVARDIVE